ncbi:hypothetical protein [Sphingobium scionense]|uniref:Uncharacterized protein n=1 Tax=Sphingobium scionense TaxID=1404341 RepID=A0A7W6LRQ1_9SPHN|nr:hypothetical protein [Sphingobium scionense]MBB4149259.1 hypothetical protein [Sphingobium scionense]
MASLLDEETRAPLDSETLVFSDVMTTPSLSVPSQMVVPPVTGGSGWHWAIATSVSIADKTRRLTPLARRSLSENCMQIPPQKKHMRPLWQSHEVFV